MPERPDPAVISEELLFGPLAKILALQHRLDDERQLAAATLAALSPALADRFRQSAAARKFRPLYDELLQICRAQSPAHSDAIGITPHIIESLERLVASPAATIVQGEDPTVASLLHRVALLDQQLRSRAAGDDERERTRKSEQLVLQLPDSVDLERAGCADLGDLEDLIAAAIGNPEDEPDRSHVVDGNAYGAGTIEIFVDSDDAVAAFESVKSALGETGLLEQMTAAYRNSDESEYIVIWPGDYTGRFEV